MKFLHLTSGILLSLSAFSQQPGVEVGIFPGYHFASNRINKTQETLDGLVSGLEISLVRNGFKNQKDLQEYGRPRIALTGRFVRLNKTDTFGFSVGIFPTYMFPVFSGKNRKGQLGIRIGYGINLNSKGYNFETNFDNRAISSPLNFALDASIRWNRQIGKRAQLSAGAGLYHVSNGSFRMPNGGINIAYAQTGLTWYFTDLNPDWNLKPVRSTGFNKSWNYALYGAVAHRELGYFKYLTRFWVFSLHQEWVRNYSPIFSIGPALDVFYDATQRLLNQPSLRVYDVKESDKFFLAGGVTANFNVRNLFLPLGIYSYLAPVKNVQEPVYLRFGLGHRLGKKYFFGMFFKGTINGKFQLQSDFMEISLGYRR